MALKRINKELTDLGRYVLFTSLSKCSTVPLVGPLQAGFLVEGSNLTSIPLAVLG
jgi:hypothetical protein